ncbi:unnamed protein product [Pleuronectes platessa]|uniref:Uncharacterized protein n=1 Tax=Pleuronectes platessa TaxID=8262 RepID=A0A9N7YTM2_PLEPL|nr:unnamed protein product [Pleuronectes platessa]
MDKGKKYSVPKALMQSLVLVTPGFHMSVPPRAPSVIGMERELRDHREAGPLLAMVKRRQNIITFTSHMCDAIAHLGQFQQYSSSQPIIVKEHVCCGGTSIVPRESAAQSDVGVRRYLPGKDKCGSARRRPTGGPFDPSSVSPPGPAPD